MDASGGIGGTGNDGSGGALLASGGAAGNGAQSGASGASGAAGASSCSPAPDVAAPSEICGNGLDDNLNGFVDENCTCTIGDTQPCFNGPPSQVNQPNCHKGSQTCGGAAEFPGWGTCQNSGCSQVTKTEICDNGIDDNCNGLVDEGCSFDMTVTIDGDCLGIPCPPQAPNPVGCDIQMQGNDDRGCVAHAAGNPAVYFQEGNACPVPGCPASLCGDAGHISGTLKCSTSTAPVALGPTNCAINKPQPTYTDNPGGCPK